MKTIVTTACLAATFGFASAAYSQVPFIDVEGQTCVAYAAGDTPGNTYAGAYGDARTRFNVNKKGKVNATCHGDDGSGIYEETAEQAKIEMDDCTIFLPDGGVAHGWGHFTSAANETETGGGNFKMVCHGQLEE